MNDEKINYTGCQILELDTSDREKVRLFLNSDSIFSTQELLSIAIRIHPDMISTDKTETIINFVNDSSTFSLLDFTQQDGER
jgi:hypothetical protein